MSGPQSQYYDIFEIFRAQKKYYMQFGSRRGIIRIAWQGGIEL